MAKVPEFKRWREESDSKQAVTEFRSWVSSILERITQALDRNLTYSENLDAEIVELELNQGQLPLIIERTFKRKPTEVCLMQITSTSGIITAFTSPVSVFWRLMSNGVEFNLVGLPSSTDNYKIRLRIM